MKKIINNVRAFDGEKLTTPTNVVIEDGYISNIGDEICEADETIEGGGKTLLPGFIDTHIHIDSRDNCVQAVKYGVTTLIDQMCENTALIDSLIEPDEPIASVRSVYMPVQSQAGPLLVEALGVDAVFAATQDDVHRIIDEQLAKGAIFIKMILDVPPVTTGMLSDELIEETVRYAHEKGKKVSAHCTTVEAYKRAAKYGVDILNHVPKGTPLPQDVFKTIRANALVVIPTMVMEKGIIRNFKKQRPDCPDDFSFVVDSVRRMYDAGVKILVGTDANHTNAMCYLKHGESLHRELELLSEAGLSNVDILRGTTVDAAKELGLLDRGSIVPGKRADLVLVDGDPTKDISVCHNIQRVWVKGIEADLTK